MDKLKVDIYNNERATCGSVDINDFFKNGYPNVHVYVDGRNCIHEKNAVRVSFSTGEIGVENTKEQSLKITKESLQGLGDDAILF